MVVFPALHSMNLQVCCNINITNLSKVFESIDPAIRQKVQYIDQLSIEEEPGQTGFLLASDNGVLLSGYDFAPNNPDFYNYLRKADGSNWIQQYWNPDTKIDDDLVDLATITLPVGTEALKSLRMLNRVNTYCILLLRIWALQTLKLMNCSVSS